jgi:nucleotide-binding universal stress UspA family protein
MAKHTYERILLFAEGTEEGMHAARDAIHLAADEQAQLLIVAVVDTATLKQLLSARIFVEDEAREYEQELEGSGRKQISYVAQLADKAGVANRTSILHGACHSVLLRQQRDEAADLLVMGAFRASMASRNVIAREKQLVLDEIPCPVLLVR